jgi:WD40 repeat protein
VDDLALKWYEWHGQMPFEQVLRSVTREDRYLLRVKSLPIGGRAERLYVSLGHDALAQVAADWDEEMTRGARFRKLTAILGTVTAVAILMLMLAARAEKKRQEAERQKAEAERAQARAETNLYFNRIALAHREWLDNHVSRARELLDECPPELRRWEWNYLNRLCHSEQLILRGPTFSPESVAFGPDGKLLALAGGKEVMEGKKLTKPREIKVCDATSGKELVTLRHATENMVHSMAFSADGDLLASTDGDTVRLWKVSTGQQLRALLGHTFVYRVRFHPDGRHLSAGSHDGSVIVWDLMTYTAVRTIQGEKDNLTPDVGLSPDGKRFTISREKGKGEREIEVRDLTDGQMVFTLPGHVDNYHKVEFSPDGKWLAAGGNDQTVRVWNAATGKEAFTLRGHNGFVKSVAFSPDGKRLASAIHSFKTGEVKIWDLSSGKEEFTLRGHGDTVIDLAFNPDGRRLAVIDDEKFAKIWDVIIGQDARIFRGHTGIIWSMGPVLGGKLFGVADYEGTTKFWDWTTGQEFRTVRPEAHLGGIGIVLNTVQGQLVVSDLVPGGVAASDKRLRPNDRITGISGADGQLLKVSGADPYPSFAHLIQGVPGTDVQLEVIPAGERDPKLYTLTRRKVEEVCRPQWVAFRPDGSQVAWAAHEDGIIRVWDTAHDRQTLTLRADSNIAFNGVVFSPDGQRLASAHWDSSVRLWELASGQQSFCLRGHTKRVRGVAFSPNGSRLASFGEDQTVKVWDATTGKELFTFRGCSSWPYSSLTFSADGRRLAAATTDNTVKVWDLVTGAELFTLRGHAGVVHATAFSPDGRRFASCSLDGTVRVWDSATRQEVLTLRGHYGWVNKVVFSPDGNRLASAGDTVRIWDATPLDDKAGRRTVIPLK